MISGSAWAGHVGLTSSDFTLFRIQWATKMRESEITICNRTFYLYWGRK